jgi:hypothetical protein
VPLGGEEEEEERAREGKRELCSTKKKVGRIKRKGEEEDG